MCEVRKALHQDLQDSKQQPRSPAPAGEDLEEFLSQGWTDEEIEEHLTQGDC